MVISQLCFRSEIALFLFSLLKCNQLCHQAPVTKREAIAARASCHDGVYFLNHEPKKKSPSPKLFSPTFQQGKGKKGTNAWLEGGC